MRPAPLRRLSLAASSALVLLALPACRGRGSTGRTLPAALSIEFSDEALPVPPELEPRLDSIGIRYLFVPALRARAQGGTVRFEPVAPPATRYPLPVYLEVRGVGDLDPYFKSSAGRAGEEIWRELRPAMESGRYGEILGVHLDLSVVDSAPEYSSALGEIRSRLPRSATLSAAIQTRLSEDQRKKWRSVGRQVDFLVPVVYGRVGIPGTEGSRVSATAAEASGLAGAVFPAYCPQAWGLLRPGNAAAAPVSDSVLNDLSEDRRFDFEFGSLLSDADENVYVFRARQSGSRSPWGAPFSAGDTVTFWENRPSDFTQSISEPLAANGKILRLRSLEEPDRLIGFSLLEDILLGRKLEPKLSFSRSAGAGEVTFLVVNSSPEYSELSRLNNWIDLRVEGAQLLDVRPGDFDRFEFYDAAGKRAVAGRARTIRFFENFVAPGESMTGGPIRLSGAASLSASAHIALPDGRVLAVPESPVTEVPAAEPPALPQKSLRGAERLPRR